MQLLGFPVWLLLLLLCGFATIGVLVFVMVPIYLWRAWDDRGHEPEWPWTFTEWLVNVPDRFKAWVRR